MKKFGFVALFAFVVFGMAFANGTDATSGSIALSGSIAPKFSMALTTNTAGAAILDDGTENLWSLGTITVQSNFKNWKVSAKSTNGGKLVNGSESIAYSFTLGSLLSAVSLDAVQTSSAQSRTLREGNGYAMSVKFANVGNDYWQTGTWTDTVTLTITHD
jgi:hypothetical protein